MNVEIVTDIASCLSSSYFSLAKIILIIQVTKFPFKNIHLLEIFGILIIIMISNSSNCTLYIHAVHCM